MNFNPYQDELCNKLAVYISDELNYYLDKFHQDNPHLTQWSKAVVGYRGCDAFDVPLSEFPLIKVYRLADLFRPETPKSTVNLRCSYCIAYPELEKLSGLMSWAAKVINLSLVNNNELNIILPHGGFRADYNTFMGQNGQPVYAFMSFSFTATE